ncbi:MAG: nucleotidyltransferase domain-containing protein [Desulfotignum sp.]|nr:nucleotidyltransferase domain-containing protein [Desulfotignum sp.]MCF8086791.1 nucleotidyltransferase domain-containing protein [Desulfotignum sp.]MCF8136741.1 nucleotidyltransferase domain-containing protein [Desulfotignum sp.]
MHDRIVKRLDEISNIYDVRILYACESGSRAWGFASRDSDFDVRFIYLRKKEWYLSIDLDQKPEVIELPIVDELDINGWDLRKALRLFQKSNPPLLEWLSSPIVYKEETTIIKKLKDLVPKSYSPISCMYHYYKMARNNFREYLKGDQVRLKKYLYVLRPVLAVLYLEKGIGPVPMEFSMLVDTIVKGHALRKSINDLLVRKMAGDELDMGPRDPVLSAFLEYQLARLADQDFGKQIQRCPVEILNGLFLEALEQDH